MKKITHFYNITKNVVIFHGQDIIAVTSIATIICLLIYWISGIYETTDIYTAPIFCSLYPISKAYTDELKRFKSLNRY